MAAPGPTISLIRVEGVTTPPVRYQIVAKGTPNGTLFLRDDGTWAAPPAAPPGVPTGAMMLYGATAAPSGWLLCDGSAVSRTTFAALFAVISTTYGAGDGSTTFNVPDYRGRTAVGTGQGTGLTNRVIGATGGEETHVLTTAEMPAHTHTESVGTGNGGTFATSATQLISNQTTGSTGGGGAHNNMQPFLVSTYIIKT